MRQDKEHEEEHASLDSDYLFLGKPSHDDAQERSGKVFRIGYLDGGAAAGNAGLVKAFLQELSKLGWNEGKNFTIEFRFAEGNP